MMVVKRILIWLPLGLSLFLIQSYLWVPTYEKQTKGNPQRLNEYITASIGDASILNPVLAADSASSEINNLIFEGLVDRDEELRFRGRLAKSWKIFEEAYFYVNQRAFVPSKGNTGGRDIIELFKKAKNGSISINEPLKRSLQNIERIEILPERQYTTYKKLDDGKGREGLFKIHIREPQRIKLILKEVDPELFENLKAILGSNYFSSFDPSDYIYIEGDHIKEKRKKIAMEILPANEHNPVIIFHLRPNIKFHDGHPFTAQDVLFTYKAIMNPKNLSPRTPDYEPVKEVEIIDPLTVRIVYKRLFSPALGTWTIGILPSHLLNDEALRKEAISKGKDPDRFSLRDSSFNRNPIGCGPFVFVEWKSDQYIKLKRFEDYWEGAPNYHRYIYRIIPDPLTQEMEFYAGTIDSYAVQPHQVNRLKDDPRFQSFSGPSFGYTYIGYNMRREPFNDRRVRKALGMAIDVDKIIKCVLYGQAERITGPFVKETDYYNHMISPLPYDPHGALRLLEEAGWKRNSEGWLERNGKRLQFTLITNSGNDIRKAIATIVQNGWKQLGIDVRTDLVEWAVFIQERVEKLDFDALILGWAMGIEPDLYQIWHSSQTGPHQLNFVGFKNDLADELIVKIREEYDHDKQVSYCHKLHEIISEEQPYTFLFVRRWTALLDRRIVMVERGPKGDTRYVKIRPTKTGNFMFHFNKWIKLPEVPIMVEGE
jgi:ABC-type transport system substrate-binding protein